MTTYDAGGPVWMPIRLKNGTFYDGTAARNTPVQRADPAPGAPPGSSRPAANAPARTTTLRPAPCGAAAPRPEISESSCHSRPAGRAGNTRPADPAGFDPRGAGRVVAVKLAMTV